MDEVIAIPTTRGQVTFVSTEDRDLTEYRWHVHKGHSGYYIKRCKRIDGKQITLSMHRIILERMIGRPLGKGEYCDHIDGNTLNNRRLNLRLATNQENAGNKKRPSTNTSGYKGVCWYKNKWYAQIHVKGKNYNLGYYDTPQEAHEAYKQAAVKHFGEFARFE